MSWVGLKALRRLWTVRADPSAGSAQARPSAPEPDRPFDKSGGTELPAGRYPIDRVQSVGEEIANSISHGLALLLALAAGPVLIVSAVRHSDVAGIVGASVFAATMVMLYATSMVYHVLPLNRAKRVFQVLDHSAIYLLIAGTYTPFTLGILRGPWGWTLFGLVWAMALAGIVLKSVAGVRWPWLSTGLYVAMGWVALIAIKPLWALMPAWGLFWLVAGGLFYTLGVGFFATDHRLRYGHFVWHLFVASGTACHFVAVLYYAGMPGAQAL